MELQLNHPLEQDALWLRTLGATGDVALDRLRVSFLKFRDNVSHLVNAIRTELPGLTVHDITHLDALWRVAHEIVGPSYPINPAEAFVLGGAILLHDAAHVRAAYPNGLAGIKATVQWRDLIAQKYSGVEPPGESDDERLALFDVLRQLHAERAHELPWAKWTIPGADEPLYLLEDAELREYYGSLIGEIAASHHWPAHRVADRFKDRRVTTPPFLGHPDWEVDAMKLAFVLRTADAAHIDSARAPRFVFALQQPSGESWLHWKFQNKLGQPRRTENGELRITSASVFHVSESAAWWLAYDTACMIDRELRDAHSIMRDERRQLLAASAVVGVDNPESFAKQVIPAGWTPVGVALRIDDIPRIVETFGGAKFYGDEPAVAIRELLQNGSDAVRALRSLGGLESQEGSVELSLEPCDDSHFWLKVTDNGVGMSRYVLTRVLLGFGNSLWASDRVRREWANLMSHGFSPAGQFGIGFFSVFMLGDGVLVSTRRHDRSPEDDVDQWTLEFDSGLRSRPLLRESRDNERLRRSGTRVAVRVPYSTGRKVLEQWQNNVKRFSHDPNLVMAIHMTPGLTPSQRAAAITALTRPPDTPWTMDVSNLTSEQAIEIWSSLAAWHCPASEVDIVVRCGDLRNHAVKAGDWLRLSDGDLLRRLVSAPSTKLASIKTIGGTVIGRLGVGNGIFQGEAALVHEGIRCGKFAHMTGMMSARKPTDVRRQSAQADGDILGWKNWAREILALNPAINLDRLRVLHRFCPEDDLRIAIVNGQQGTMEECIHFALNQEDLLVFYDDLHTKAWDQGFQAFGPGFRFSVPSVVFPDDSGHKIDEVLPNLPGINYRQRFEERLKSAWTDFQVQEKVDGVIGTNGTLQIMREAFRYRRKLSS